MSDCKPTLFVLLLFCSLTCLDSNSKNKFTVKAGENATLECYSSEKTTIALLRWNKNMAKSYVFFFRRDNFTEDSQDPLFKDRVKMKDEKWKETGDFSVIIENVNSSYSGTYECHAGYGKRKDLKYLNSTTLMVEEPGNTEEHNKDGGNKGEENEGVEKETGSAELIVGLVVGALVLVGAVSGFVYFYRKKCRNTSTEQNSYQPAAKKEEHEMSERSSELN